MPSADQVPINNPHSTMLGGSWVVLIAGSTGSALRAVRPPNLHITPVVRRDLVYRACVDGSELARDFFTFCSIGRCSHVFGLLMRFTRPQAIMPSADRVPTNNSHSRMLWHKWVVLIAGATGSALRAVRPPNLHITPVIRRDLVYAASATGSLYRSPLTIMAQTIRASLLASAIAATFVGRRASKAVSQGRCLVPWILA